MTKKYLAGSVAMLIMLFAWFPYPNVSMPKQPLVVGPCIANTVVSYGVSWKYAYYYAAFTLSSDGRHGTPIVSAEQGIGDRMHLYMPGFLASVLLTMLAIGICLYFYRKRSAEKEEQHP